MANVPEPIKIKLQSLLQMSGGYVLDYSNEQFQQLIRNSTGIDIFSSKHTTNGTSKAKVLRRFWEIENERTVGKVIEDLLLVLEAKHNIQPEKFPLNKDLYKDCINAAYVLQGKKISSTQQSSTEQDFLNREFDEVSIDSLQIDGSVAEVIAGRIREIKLCIKSEAALSVVFMCGSVLEGLLLGVAARNVKKFNTCKATPRNLEGHAKQLHEWTLASFIDVCYELKVIGLDVKKHSHALRDFRNYIHPYQQMSSGFNPDKHTALISWQVLKAAMHDLSKNMSTLDL